MDYFYSCGCSMSKNAYMGSPDENLLKKRCKGCIEKEASTISKSFRKEFSSLEGSPKQIVWAESIRDTILYSLESDYEKIFLSRWDDKEVFLLRIRDFIEKVCLYKDARFFIDIRSNFDKENMRKSIYSAHDSTDRLSEVIELLR